MTRNDEPVPASVEPTGEIDLNALAAALRRRGRLLGGVALGACLLVAVIVNVITPRYTAQSQVLLEHQETFFTRPDRANFQASEQAQQLDPEAVASQVQLITSRDIARRAIKELHLEGNDEFDAKLNPFERVLVLLGLEHDPAEARDTRIVTKFLEKLTVYSAPKTRVIAIEFTSRDPDLAARAANTVAALYLKEQSTAKRQTAQDTADALATQITDLRARLVKADDAREQYRLQTGLLAGSNNMTITGQQLADINTDLSKARSAQADSQAKAQMIRDLLRRGQAANVTEVINNDTVRRIAEQRAQVDGQLALESRTLLPGHPRIKALMSQAQEYERALKNAAKQAATTLENEATIAGSRVKNLETVLSQQKTLVGTANVDEVHLRALTRAADSLKEQLESSTTKYQEALARAASDATPSDARIIQSAMPPQDPSFPKKMPFIVFGTVAALVLAIGFVVAGELMGAPAVGVSRATPVREAPPAEPVPVEGTVWDKPRGWHLGRRAREDDAPPLEEDLAFAPAPAPVGSPARASRRPSVTRLRSLAAGGIMGGVVARLRRFGQSAAAERAELGHDGDADHDAMLAQDQGVGWDAAPATPTRQTASPMGGPTSAAVSADDGSALAERIVAAHVPGHGLHVVAAGVAAEDAGTLIDLARMLAEKGRSIIVDLDRSPAKLAILTPSGMGSAADVAGLIGLSELLVGDASFAEVIHRDHASRLHFIPTGRLEADFRDFDLILDALTATYDFIVMLAPATPQSEIARIMAPYADFVVLAPPAGADAALVADVERELAAAGAREVLVIGRDPHPPHQHVA